MNEARRRLAQGVVMGSFFGAGVVFVAVWHVISSAANAGAMVGGEFRAYHSMPEWRIILVGGLVMMALSLASIAAAWRAVGKGGS